MATARCFLALGDAFFGVLGQCFETDCTLRHTINGTMHTTLDTRLIEAIPLINYCFQLRQQNYGLHERVAIKLAIIA